MVVVDYIIWWTVGMPVLQLLYPIIFVGGINMYPVLLTYRYVDVVLCPFLETHCNDTLVCTARVAGYSVFAVFCGIIAYALVIVIYQAVLECTGVVFQKMVRLFQWLMSLHGLQARGAQVGQQARDGSTQPEHGNNVAVSREPLGRNPLRFCSRV